MRGSKASFYLLLGVCSALPQNFDDIEESKDQPKNEKVANGPVIMSNCLFV